MKGRKVLVLLLLSLGGVGQLALAQSRVNLPPRVKKPFSYIYEKIHADTSQGIFNIVVEDIEFFGPLPTDTTLVSVTLKGVKNDKLDLEFYNCSLPYLYIAESMFKHLNIGNSDLGFFGIGSCSITSGLFIWFSEAIGLELVNNTLHGPIKIIGVKDKTIRNLFIGNNNFYYSNDEIYSIKSYIKGNLIEIFDVEVVGELTFEANSIHSVDGGVHLGGSSFQRVRFRENQGNFNFKMNDCIVNSTFEYVPSKNHLYKFMAWSGNNLDGLGKFYMKFNTSLDHGLAVLDENGYRYLEPDAGDSLLVTPSTASLLNSYKTLHSLYLKHGDRESANQCFIKFKTLETKVLAYTNSQNPTTTSFFDLQVNRFIGFFCDYGTNPAKALVYSFYLVLCFAGVYCFFPSVPDNLMRRRWLPYYQNLIRYLSETTRLPDLQGERMAGRLEGLDRFRTSLEEHADDMPRLLRWLGTRLYRWASLSYRFRRWLYQKADVLPVTWQHLTRLQRMSVSFRLSAYTFFFLFWGVCMRLINALALSLNAFVTLGYGEIQARGVSRYLAVVEGVCGWLLLSIFSVSLISQLLQ